MADKYCNFCGEKLNADIQRVPGYDTLTGQPLYQVVVECPNRQGLFGFRHYKQNAGVTILEWAKEMIGEK